MDHTTLANPDLLTGRLVEAAVPPREGLVAMELPDTDYLLHLAVDSPPPTGNQGRVRGRITAQARKLDIVHTGGRFIEPSVGRPRRLQGRVVAVDTTANTLTIKAAVPFVCKLDDLQKVDQFPLGSLVRCNIERGARFEPME